jgi:hypothetical protein
MFPFCRPRIISAFKVLSLQFLCPCFWGRARIHTFFIVKVSFICRFHWVFTWLDCCRDNYAKAFIFKEWD